MKRVKRLVVNGLPTADVVWGTVVVVAVFAVLVLAGYWGLFPLW